MDALGPIYPWKTTYPAQPKWPEGVRMVIVLSCEYEVIRDVPRLPDGSRDLRGIGLHEFEGRVGIQRSLEILERAGVHGTFFVNGSTVDLLPDSVLDIHRRGHEIAAHGHVAEDLWKLGEEAERRLISEARARIAKLTGAEPAGWLSPRARQSEHTMRLLAEQAFFWNTDMFDSELPYLVEIGGRPLIELPRSFSADDIMMPHENPRAMFHAWQDEFDFLYAESARAPRMLVLTWHPYITGRPSRAKALEDVIRHIQGHQGVWFARCTELAEYCRANWFPQAAIPGPARMPGS